MFTIRIRSRRWIMGLALLVLGCNPTPRIGSDSVSFYQNGNVEHLAQPSSSGNELQIRFRENGDLATVYHLYDSMPVGVYSQYINGFLYHQRQYIIVDGKKYINQYWNFDESGNIIRELSNFFILHTSGDTARINEPWDIDIDLVCPYFGKDMEVEFRIDPTGNDPSNRIPPVRVHGKDHRVHRSFVFHTAGEVMLKAVIFDFDTPPGDTSSTQKARKLYLTKSITVIAQHP